MERRRGEKIASILVGLGAPEGSIGLEIVDTVERPTGRADWQSRQVVGTALIFASCATARPPNRSLSPIRRGLRFWAARGYLRDVSARRVADETASLHESQASGIQRLFSSIRKGATCTFRAGPPLGRSGQGLWERDHLPIRHIDGVLAFMSKYRRCTHP